MNIRSYPLDYLSYNIKLQNVTLTKIHYWLKINIQKINENLFGLLFQRISEPQDETR